ncbi:MAG: carboxypeptidase-like regulatory domain-containing protein [Anaerolineaceae bacterium]|nr:carboxypeptidase-like regulatory domain-containing protein [Anaerolineaceae bacterium]
MRKTITSVLIVAVLLVISSILCTYLPSSLPVPTLPSGRLDATMSALQNLAAAQSSNSSNPGGSSAAASISGKVSYPDQPVPDLHVVAFNLKTGAFYTAVVHSSGLYQIEHITAGGYHVVAYPINKSGTPALTGGYSQAVVCGLGVSCTDHTLVLVRVVDGAHVAGIDPNDFNAPAGAFPQDPNH